MLYQIEGDELIEQRMMQFDELEISERKDLQRLLLKNPGALGEELLIIAEEFGDWEDARRRIDLLALDREARLVVIELKRTNDGGHMELQAIRYAAMVSAMTFEDLVRTYAKYRLGNDDLSDEARTVVTRFLDRCGDGADIDIATDVRIILCSRNFGREITTTVLWLNDVYGMDIRCVRMVPYRPEKNVYLDIQQIIPLPEAQDYQVKLRRKEVARDRSDNGGRGLTIMIDGAKFEERSKRDAALRVVSELNKAGVSCEQMQRLLFKGAFRNVEGLISDPDDLLEALQTDHPIADPERRWFIHHPLLDPEHNRTWVLTTQWRENTKDLLQQISDNFPDRNVIIQDTDREPDA